MWIKEDNRNKNSKDKNNKSKTGKNNMTNISDQYNIMKSDNISGKGIN